MPIQFLCVSCEHPIEIDDEWAGKSVACPFCRNTVVAPVESTYEPPSVVPAARGVEPDMADGTRLPPPGPSGGNLVALWAFGCASLSLLAFFVFSVVIMSRVVDDLGPEFTPQQFQQYMSDLLKAGQPPKWLGSALLAFFLAAALWVAGLICAILALRLRNRRGFAYAAIGLLGVLPGWILLDILMGG